MKITRTLVGLTAAILLFAGRGAEAQQFEIYDASREFSVDSNPTANGVWSYGYAPDLARVAEDLVLYSETNLWTDFLGTGA